MCVAWRCGVAWRRCNPSAPRRVQLPLLPSSPSSLLAVAAGENKSAHAAPAGVGHLRKLEEDTDTFKHATVGTELRLAIQQARLAKKLTQKELAALIAEKPTIINDYEAGRAIPNGNLLSKLERALGVRLPRPPKK